MKEKRERTPGRPLFIQRVRGRSMPPHRGMAIGFTLTEIMIVVAIIGLLATLSVPEVLRVRARAWAQKCVNNLRLIQDAKYQYHIENAVPDTVFPSYDDVGMYFNGGEVPDCPSGSVYTINQINENPVCNSGLEDHELSGKPQKKKE